MLLLVTRSPFIPRTDYSIYRMLTTINVINVVEIQKSASIPREVGCNTNNDLGFDRKVLPGRKFLIHYSGFKFEIELKPVWKVNYEDLRRFVVWNKKWWRDVLYVFSTKRECADESYLGRRAVNIKYDALVWASSKLQPVVKAVLIARSNQIDMKWPKLRARVATMNLQMPYTS